jgi:small multidrug resistance pump
MADPVQQSSRWLLAAGVYNLAWGALVILQPDLIFDLTGTPRINYPEIWQCVGMIVGVYGIGYLIASTAPRVHWAIVLVGLLGKICGPVGFVFAVSRGVFPLSFGATILTNDLIWWVPFGWLLYDAWRVRQTARADRLRNFSAAGSAGEIVVDAA